MTSETEAVITLKPDMDDLVPSEASPRQSIGDPASVSSFPKVLRRRLDKFFADRNISPKADRTMWVKIAAGLAVLRAAGLLSTRSGRIHGSLLPSTFWAASPRHSFC